MAKKTAKQVVAEATVRVKGMTVAELVNFGKESGFDSRAGFASYKKALLEVAGVDFNSLNAARREAKAEELETACNHRVTLFSDAKASHDRFAICGSDREVVWYGKFFDNDRDYNGEQSTGEMAAAKKAVWLASKIAEALGERAVALTLIVDAEWLCWANGTNPKVGGKAKALREAAQRLNVALTVQHINGTSNPADSWTTSRGFKKWSDNDLAALAEPINN